MIGATNGIWFWRRCLIQDSAWEREFDLIVVFDIRKTEKLSLEVAEPGRVLGKPNPA